MPADSLLTQQIKSTPPGSSATWDQVEAAVQVLAGAINAGLGGNADGSTKTTTTTGLLKTVGDSPVTLPTCQARRFVFSTDFAGTLDGVALNATNLQPQGFPMDASSKAPFVASTMVITAGYMWCLCW